MTKKSTYSKDVQFLFEMGSIRFIDRMWRRFQRDDYANLAEHHFRMFWLAMVIAAHEGNVDTGKIAKMVLVHDIAESRTGDVDYLARQYVERNEELAINDMLDGTALAEEFLALWREYEKRQSKEAKIVKDADNLDVDFELVEQSTKGSQMHKVWKLQRDSVAENKLFTKTAKHLRRQLFEDSPHDWHTKGRNRINSGDWKEVGKD